MNERRDTIVRLTEPRASAPLSVSVVVATFRRVRQLSACLDGIELQALPAAEVLVVTHGDPESLRYVTERARTWPQLSVVEAGTARSVAAYNAGLRAARAPLIAYIDDDAVPAPDWLGRIVEAFDRDPAVAGVGGRDLIVRDGRPLSLRRRAWRPPSVGRIQWFGRMTANHHLGAGDPRDVDVLKGVNMSFRREAVSEHGFDERLRGPGAVVHAELSICLPLRKRGLRVVYDPRILVLHYPAPRPAGDHRASLEAEATRNASHNEALEIFEYLGPAQRGAFIVWSVLFGNTDSPGLAVLLRDVVRGKPRAGIRFVAAQQGRLLALSTARRPRPRLRPSAVVHVETGAGGGGGGSYPADDENRRARGARSSAV